MPENFEDIPTHTRDNRGVEELAGFRVGDPVVIQGYQGHYKIENIFPATETARVYPIGDQEDEDPFDVPLSRLEKAE